MKLAVRRTFEMDMRQQIGSSLPLLQSLQISSNSSLMDDLFLFDNSNFSLMDVANSLGNLDIDLSLNFPEFPSFLDCNGANASDSNFGPPSLVSFPQSSGQFLPADEGSGTTNTTPDFCANHPQRCLETSSSQHRVGGQAEISDSAQEPIVSSGWKVVEEGRKQSDVQAKRGIWQPPTELQKTNQCLLLKDTSSDFQEAHAVIHKSKKHVHRNEPAMLAVDAGSFQASAPFLARNVYVQEQSSPGDFSSASLDSAQKHRSISIPVIEEKQEHGTHADRFLSVKVSGQQSSLPQSPCTGNLGLESSNGGLGLKKRTRVSETSNVCGSGSVHQAGVKSNLIDDGVGRFQETNQLLGLVLPINNHQKSPGSVNLLNQQRLAQAQTAKPLLTSGPQSVHQQHTTDLVEEHVDTKFMKNLPQNDLTHEHAVNKQSRFQQVTSDQSNNLPVEHLQMDPLQSINHSSPHIAFQLLQSDSFGGNRTANNFVTGVPQSIPKIPQRLQSQQMQGMNAEGRDSIQYIPRGGRVLSGQQVDTALRHSVSPGLAAKCEQLLMQCIQEQRRRPLDNNILFWRELVEKFFTEGAVKRWCLTSYNASSIGRHAQGLFPMDYWFCNLCGVEPGRGFESRSDVLPRLFKINYDSGLLDEVLFLDLAEARYILNSRSIVLEYSNAVHESIFPELRVIRYGRLRVTFSPSLKIHLWEFCTETHEEFVPRKSLLQQVHQLADWANKTDQDGSYNNGESFISCCNAFTAAAKNLAVKLDAPAVNDLGFSKRYVRCLQIAEVVNSMKELITFEKKTGLGPIGSLSSFPSARKAKLDQVNSELLLRRVHRMPSHSTDGFPAACCPSPQASTLTNVSACKLNRLQAKMVQSRGSHAFHDYETSPTLAQSSAQLQTQLQPHVRYQMEARLSNLIRPEMYGLMQPPAPLQVPTITPARSVPHVYPEVTQLSCEPSTLQSYSQQYSKSLQHIQQHNQNQWIQQASSQVHSPSHSVRSVNPLGQHSLPGTPQREDMRTCKMD